MRTLFVHSGGIGDFILACPAVAALAAEGEVTLAGLRSRLELAVAAGLAAAAHDLDLIDFGSVFSAPSERLNNFLRDFDRAVVWMEDTDTQIQRAFQEAGVGETQCFPGLPRADCVSPAWHYYLQCLGLPIATPPHLDIEAAEGGGETILHPGSGGKKKCWGHGRFTWLAAALAEDGHRVRWCVGPAEEEMSLAPNMERLPPMSLADLGGHLAGARLYIGNDSGITHLAAAVGCPTIAIFGCTDPRVWGPSGAQVRILGGINAWPCGKDVLAAATGLLRENP